MLRRRERPPTTTTSTDAPAFKDLRDWVLSLPWVVERPCSVDTPGVRCFGVDCEPMGRRQLWLITGMPRQNAFDGIALAVIVPAETADDLQRMGWGRIAAPMPAHHALVIVDADSLANRQNLEALVLTAYGCAMS